ncbi:MAG TPA: Crp/Fnr family transcriptional regulator [Pyrinomonadaceae bacterium]|jgi:CRP-like cAMP-binding protein|nr:Crp/Fnr family transcriptional regulator [Pyrinomonadaceae bacterium]
MTANKDSRATGNRLLACLPAEEFDLLSPHLERVKLSHGDPLIKPGEPIRRVYFPVSCLGSLVAVMEDGSMVEAGSVGREGMVGVPVLLADGVTTMETVVQIPGESYAAPPQVVKELFDRGGPFQKLLYKYIHTVFIVASQTAACNRLHRIEARLCRWLLMSSDGIGSGDLRLTQEYLAAMLGVRRAGVSETVGKVEEEGLVRHNRGRIEVVDRAGLERCACECYRIVRGEYERLLGPAG